MDKRKNISLILAVAIPILMIFLIIASIYWPRATAHPKFNFLYLMGENYINNQQYVVQNEKLIFTQKNSENNAKFYIYDTTQNKSTEISFQDAQKLNLNANLKSPDGFEVVSGGNDGGIFPLFFGSTDNYYSRYLKNDHTTLKLNIPHNYNFRFLGWVKS